jgi:hypothetical protein
MKDHLEEIANALNKVAEGLHAVAEAIKSHKEETWQEVVDDLLKDHGDERTR